MTALSYIEVDSEALRNNLIALKSLCRAGTEICAVVKANAYGHGLEWVVRAIDGEVDAFAVDDIEELRQLRTLTNRRAILLGYVPRSCLDEAVTLDAELAVYDLDQIRELQKACVSVGVYGRIHLKVDALLGRQGILPSDSGKFAELIRECDRLELASVYSHFGNIEDTTDLSHSYLQTEAFEQALASVQSVTGRSVGRHESATSGAMARESEESQNTMVRLGIGLYGLYPSVSMSRSFAHLNLKPVMRWVTHLAQVKELPAHHPVGYGLTYITPRKMRIGIVPQGYSDGYDRGFSNASEVLVKGIRCPVLGRIAMNMFAVDLTSVGDAVAEDEVVLLGRSGNEVISAEELAQRIGTINYEIVSRVSPSLPRVPRK